MQRDINSSLAVFGLFFIAIRLGVVGLHKFRSLISRFVVAVACSDIDWKAFR